MTRSFLILLLLDLIFNMTPIGSPDFGQNPSTNPTAPNFDPGEDTTRLLMGGGSQSRSGRWIFATGFEEGATPFLISSASGTGGEAKIKNDATYQGLGAFGLTAGNAVNNFAYLQKIFFYPGSNYGIEFLMARQFANNCEVEISIESAGKGNSGNMFRVGKIVIAIEAGPAVKIYYDVNGSRTLIRNVTSYLTATANLFHYIKFVFDVNNNVLQYLVFDDLRFELNVNGYEYAAPVSSSTYAKVNLINKFAGINPQFYFDNLIITADEP